MRLLLVGAFAYPHDQGSQVYFQEQAIALRAAGAEVELLTYGPGPSPSAGRDRSAGSHLDEPVDAPLDDPDRWRALDGFVHTVLPTWAVPSSSRSGPQPGKPFADICLALALRRMLRGQVRKRAPSGLSSDASSDASPNASCRASKPFDAILAHHAEAALLALHAPPRSRPPVIYCAHTLLEHELPEYVGPARKPPRASPIRMTSRMTGRTIDRWIARRADAWIALTQSAERVIHAASARPGRRIAPPLPDPSLACDQHEATVVARSHGLVPGHYFLYSGNLDPYQDLPLLGSLAAERSRRCEAPGRPQHRAGARIPIVIATHDARAHEVQFELVSPDARSGAPGLRLLQIRSPREANALVAAARASLVPRRSVGGFPIKLVNSLAAGTPVVAFHGEEWGLSDGHDCLLGSLDQPIASLARALDRLEADESLAARLGAGARATYRARHDPARIAAETLALVESLRVGDPG